MGIFCATGGLVALAAMALGWIHPPDPADSHTPMRPLAALNFVLLGIAFAARGKSLDTPNIVGTSAAALSLALTLAVSAEWMLNTDFRIDDLFFDHALFHRPDMLHCARMRPTTAVVFILLASSALLLRNSDLPCALAQVFGFCAIVIALIASDIRIRGSHTDLPQYFFHVDSLPTIAGFGMLGIAPVLASAHRGFMPVFLSRFAGGTRARRLLPVALLAILCVAALDSLAKSLGIYSPASSSAVLMGFTLVAITGIIWLNAQALNSRDEESSTQRQATQIALLENQSRLDAIFSAATDAIVTLGPDSRIEAINRQAELLFLVSAEQAVNKNIDWFLEQFSSPSNKPDEENTSHGRNVISTARRADGKLFPVELSISTAIVNGLQYSVLIIRDITERRKTNLQMNQLNERLRSLALRLQNIREDERTTLAREIHDILAQDLTRLKIEVVWCRRKLKETAQNDQQTRIAERLSLAVEEIDGAITTVQRIATGLRPALLDHFGLVAAIEWEAQDFATRSSIPCHTIVPSDEPDITGDQATALFRILQESLTNIIRHAEATNVEIRLHTTSADIILEIVDNGRGISDEHLQDARSIGLLGMQERALAFHGTVDIVTSPGGGSTITARLPLKASL